MQYYNLSTVEYFLFINFYKIPFENELFFCQLNMYKK